MELVAEYQLQNVVEQYLAYGAGGKGPLAEAFGWSWSPAGPRVGGSEEDAHEEMLLNDLFHDEDEGAELEGWRSAVEKMLKQVCRLLLYLLPCINHLSQLI
jgi:hypothetical protein